MSKNMLIIITIVAGPFLLAAVFFVVRKLLERFGPTDPDGKKKKRTISIGCFVGLLIIVGGALFNVKYQPCSSISVSSIASPKCIKDTVAIDGSTALQPLVQLVATAYTKVCPQSQFNVRGSTSDHGLKSVEDHTNSVVIGSSDYLAPQGPSDLVDHVVAVAIFCVIVHKGVNITNLSTDNLKDIYNGHFTDWKQLKTSENHITVYTRTTGSGTRKAFDDAILGGPEQVTNAPAPIEPTDELIKAVAQKPGAIGYASLYSVKDYNDKHPDDTVKIIDIGGVTANTPTVKNGSYSFWSYEHMYTKKQNTPDLAQSLIDYMNSNDGIQIAETHSFVKIADMLNSGRCPS